VHITVVVVGQQSVQVSLGQDRVGWEDVNWIHLAQERDQWRTVVNEVMKLRVLWKARNFLTS